MNRRAFVQSGLTLGAALLTQDLMARAAPLDAAAWRAARRYASTSFGRIAYVERGSGPAALFLHGFPLNGFQWRGVLDALAPHRRCIAPDLLALGYTEVAPGQSVAPDAQVAMLIAFMDRLGVDSADVIASDSGGAVAQLLLIHHPRRVRSLLLANCDSEHDCPPPALAPVIELAREGKFVDRWLVPWIEDKALARSAEGIGGMCYADSANPTDEAIDTYLRPLAASERSRALTHQYAIALDRNWLADAGPALKVARAPVRVVWGMADAIFSSANAGYFEHAFGNGRGVRRLEGAKLFWPEERPEVIVQEALELWGIRM